MDPNWLKLRQSFPISSGSNEKSPNSFNYNEGYDSNSLAASASMTQGLGLSGDFPLHGLSLDQQAAYLHGLGVQFSSGYHALDKR